VHEGYKNTRTAATDGVAEGDRPAVNVNLLWIDAKLANACERLGCESFIDFEQIDFVKFAVCHSEYFLRCEYGSDE
jgi:hypothetical protein